MAGESKPRTQVPKIHTEKAKAAAMQAKVALDMEMAKIKARQEVARAQLKAKTNMLSFMGSQLDAKAQAKADAEAQGTPEPTGPQVNVAPLPDASQPSQGMSGAQGLDLNALLTAPGAVNGGAGIQSATGGMGRAQPGGVDPAQLQGQVSPFNVSQSTVTRNSPMEVQSGWGGPSSITIAPSQATETRIEPNQLTPYQIGQLQIKAQNSYFANTIKPTLDTGSAALAQAKALRYAGLMSPEEYAKVEAGVRNQVLLSGLPESATALIDARADAEQGTVRQEHFESYPELQKELRILDTLEPDTLAYRATVGRIMKLSTREDNPLNALVRFQIQPAIRELNENIERAGATVNQFENLDRLYDINPQLLGVVGKASRVTTSVLGVFEDVWNQLRPSKLTANDLRSVGGIEGYQNSLNAAGSNLDSLMNEIRMDPKRSEDEIAQEQKAYGAYRKFLADPKVTATAEQLRAILAINIATSNLDRATIMGIEKTAEILLPFESASAEQARQRLKTQILTEKTRLNNYIETGKTYGEYWQKPNFTYPDYVGGRTVPRAGRVGDGSPSSGPKFLGMTPQPIPGIPNY